MSNELEKLWLDEFAITTEVDGFKGYCKLCGNTGYVDTTPKSPHGERLGVFKSFCICPNGRAYKNKFEQQLD